MSIIQEALKKVEKSKVEQLRRTDTVSTEKTAKSVFLDVPVAVVKDRSSTGGKNKILPFFYMALLLIAIFGIITLLPKSSSHLIGPVKNKAAVADPVLFMKRSDNIGALITDNPLYVAPYLKSSSHTLSGIMFLDDGPRAILNNSIVREGEIVGGCTVKKINKKSVVLEKDGVEVSLELQ